MSLAADAPLWIATTAYVLGAIVVPVALRRRALIRAGTARSAVHLLAGLAVVTVPYYRTPVLPVMVALGATAITFASRPGSRVLPLRILYEAIAEPAEGRARYLQGPFHYCLAITLVVAAYALLLPSRLHLAVAASLLMIVADPLASVAGRRWGRRKLPMGWTGTERTYVGSAVFFVSALIVCSGYLWAASALVVTTALPPGSSDVAAYGLAAALAGTAIEAISPSTYDDLTVPLGSAGVLFLVSRL